MLNSVIPFPFSLDHIICDIHCENWSEWIEGPCSSTCDAGTKTRRRERKCDQEKDECVLFQTNQSACQNTSCSGKLIKFS